MKIIDKIKSFFRKRLPAGIGKEVGVSKKDTKINHTGIITSQEALDANIALGKKDKETIDNIYKEVEGKEIIEDKIKADKITEEIEKGSFHISKIKSKIEDFEENLKGWKSIIISYLRGKIMANQMNIDDLALTQEEMSLFIGCLESIMTDTQYIDEDSSKLAHKLNLTDEQQAVFELLGDDSKSELLQKDSKQAKSILNAISIVLGEADKGKIKLEKINFKDLKKFINTEERKTIFRT